jgi:uncharacterized protein (UPF0333 family)
MFNKKGQNVVEYSILIALVVGAAIAMQTYVKRGLQGRVKDVVDYTGNNTTTGETATFTGGQYEPYYAVAQSTISSNRNVTESVLANGQMSRTGVDEGTIKEAQSYERTLATTARNYTSSEKGN